MTDTADQDTVVTYAADKLGMFEIVLAATRAAHRNNHSAEQLVETLDAALTGWATLRKLDIQDLCFCVVGTPGEIALTMPQHLRMVMPVLALDAWAAVAPDLPFDDFLRWRWIVGGEGVN